MVLKAKFIGREAVNRKLRQIVPEAEAEYAKAIEDGAKELAEAIRARAPRGETGEYAASIEAGKLAGRNDGRKPIGIEATKDPHAWGIFADWKWRFLEFGTKAHAIVTKLGKRLSFTDGDGERVFAAKVSHPGAAAQPHIFPTFRAMRKRLRSRVARSINKAVRKVAGK